MNFNKFYKAHNYFLECILRKRGYLNADTNSIIINDTVMAIWGKIEQDGLDSIRKVKSYLVRIALNKASSHYKKNKPGSNPIQEPSPNSPSQEPNPEQNIIEKEKVTNLQKLIEQLPRKERLAITCKSNGLSNKEIAEKLGCSTDAASKRVQRGREKLLTLIRNHK